MGQTAALTVDIERRFASGFEMFARLDVALTPGSILVLFGPSGAGKTSMFRHIAGLERPGAGRIGFNDETWCDIERGIWRSPQQRRVGVVFQEPALFPHLSVGDNIAYGVTTPAPSERASEMAALVGVTALESRRPHALSGGEAQRVALARALAPGPRLLLLDEPFASLDGPTRSRLRRDVRSLLRSTGTPAVLITHDRIEAMALGDAMAVVIGGRVRQLGPVADVFSHPVDAGVAAALGIEAVQPARVVGSSSGVVTVKVGDVVLDAGERDPLPAGAEVYACIRAEDVALETQSPAHASTRNHLVATVVAIAPEGPLDRVTLDCGFVLDALITRRSREELRLTAGGSITAAIKAMAIHLVPKD